MPDRQTEPPLVSPQTSIQTDGYRSLREGEEVEFNIETGDDGRTKAVNVTGPNGAPPQVSCKAGHAAATVGPMCTLFRGGCEATSQPHLARATV